MLVGLDADMKVAVSEEDQAALKQQTKAREAALLPMYLQVRCMHRAVFAACSCTAWIVRATQDTTAFVLRPSVVNTWVGFCHKNRNLQSERKQKTAFSTVLQITIIFPRASL